MNSLHSRFHEEYDRATWAWLATAAKSFQVEKGIGTETGEEGKRPLSSVGRAQGS